MNLIGEIIYDCTQLFYLYIYSISFWQSMHVTNTYVILFLASAKTDDIGMFIDIL